MTRIYTAPKGQTDSRAKRGGESLANRGMEFEHELMAMHGLYNRRGLARIEKNFCPTQPLKDARFARIIGRAIVDFTGITSGGRFVAFDAKDCAESRITLDRLQAHQAEYLMDVFTLGGSAFVLARFRRRDVYKIPIDVWTDAEMYHKWGVIIERADGWRPKNRASLSVADMKPEWAVNGVDWMGVMGG